MKNLVTKSQAWARMGALGMIAMAEAITPEPAAGVPVVKMAWGSCSPAHGRADFVTREGATSGVLQIWVEGQTSGSQAYELDLEFWNPTGDHVADAWRFDPEGCQPESLLILTYRNLHPTGQACSFGLSEPQPVYPVVFENEYDEPGRRARMRLEVRYLSPTSQVNPNARYRLAELFFVQSLTSVNGEATEPGTCGGLEQPLCFRVTDARYQDPEGVWVAWEIGAPVTAHGDGTPIPECDVVPARPATWGRVKAGYR